MNPIVAYHGSLRRFERFAALPPRRLSGSTSAALGVFCVEDARIAAHFTLRRHVINEGYEDAQGSRLLRDDPWALDADPFERTASVARVHVRLRSPKVWTLPEWIAWLEDLEARPPSEQAVRVAAQKEAWQAAGHDGLCILAWDGQPLAGGRLPTVETDATTWVAFQADRCEVVCWTDAVSAWRAAP